MEEQTTKKRPAFITVLGILGFIGAGWSIIANFIAFFAYKAADALTSGFSEAMSESFENMEGVEGVEGMEELGGAMSDAFAGMDSYAVNVASNGATVSILNIVLSVVALFGVIMMWKLKKSGFFTYTIAQVVALLLPLFFYGFGLATIIGLGFSGIFTVLFIILWGVNLKHMS